MAAASQPRAWEARERQWHQRSFAEDRWESEPEGKEYDYNTMSTLEAAGLLFDTIVDAKVGGKISARWRASWRSMRLKLALVTRKS